MLKRLKNSKFGEWIQILKERFQVANVSDSAVVLAYYILLSLFPMLIIMGNLLKVLGVSYIHLMNTLYLIFPTKIYKYLQPLVKSSLQNGGKTQLSIGLIVTIWSASRALAAFQRTSNLAYGFRRHNVITNRLSSLVWMIVFIIGIIGVTFITIFNEKLFKIIAQYIYLPYHTYQDLSYLRLPLTLLVLFILIASLYYLLPKARVEIKYVWQGATFSTIGLIVLSKFFSLYIKYFTQSLSTYRAMGIFIILMFWLYFMGLDLLFGAVLNASLQQYFQKHIPAKHISPKLKKAFNRKDKKKKSSKH